MIKRCITLLTVLFVLAGIIPSFAFAASLVNWSTRSPLPTGQSFNGVTYGNGTYVAVGNNGTIVTSNDGVSWTDRTSTSGTMNDVTSVTYGNGLFMVVGNSGTIVTSSDGGQNWTSSNSGTMNTLKGVSYGKVNGIDTFVAVGTNGTLLSSTNGGANWTPHPYSWANPISAASTYNSVTYGKVNGIDTFVAVLGNVAIATSIDGASWSPNVSGTSNNLNGVTYSTSGNGTYVAVGNIGTIVTGTIVISIGVPKWSGTPRTSGTANGLTGVTFGNGTYVAVGNSGTILTSSDLVNWTPGTSGTANGLTGVTYGKINNLDAFVAVGLNGTIVTSSDGANWTSRILGTTNELYGITYSNGTYVAVGDLGTIVTSSDGAIWTSRTLGTTNYFNSITYGTYGNGTYVAVGSGGTIVTSSDGVIWTSRTSGTANGLTGVTYGNGTYVAVGYLGTIVTSSDGGATWTPRTTVNTVDLNGVSYGKVNNIDAFVAVGSIGTIMTSIDRGQTWADRTSTSGASGTTPVTGNDLSGVTYNNGKYVAVGGIGTIVTSSDGLNWARSTTDAYPYTLKGVTYGSGTYAAVGSNGKIFTSIDGATTWTSRASGITNYLSGVTYGNGTYVAVGDKGKILQYAFPTPPSLTADTTNNDVASTIELTFTDDSTWRGAITEVKDGANTVTGAVYSVSTGKITLGAGKLAIGNHTITIAASGYKDAVVSQVITATPAPAQTTSTILMTPIPTPIDNKVVSTDGKLTLPVGKIGEVSLGDAIKITIPADASVKELKLTIEILLDTQKLLTDKDILASPVYEILKNFTDNFSKPVTLTLSFDPASLKSNQKAAVFYYDELKNVWVEVAGGKVNGDHITVDVNHFTKYAVLAIGQASVEPITVHTPDMKTEVNFSDMSGHWAAASIKQAVSSVIVSGYPDGTFKPDSTVTRAEFAVMLMNTLKPQGEGAALTFTDTAKIETWAQKAVAQAVHAGFIKGYEDGSFRPNAEITRTQMAAMIARALRLTVESKTATGFADDKDIPVWAKGTVAAIKQLGIVAGKGANEFAPAANTTRAEAVTVLLKMLAQKSK